MNARAGPQQSADCDRDRHGDRVGAAHPRLLLEPLLPAGEPESAAALVEGLGLWERPAQVPARPRVLLNMVSTADGRATLGGHSGPISGVADRQLFHALRAAVDAVLVGAGTVRAERYGRLIPDAERRALRRRRGLSEEPLACIVSGRLRLTLEGDIPLLDEPGARVAILTASPSSLPAARAQLEYVRAQREGLLDLKAALATVAERFAVSVLLCEGGPHLACQLLADGLVDELFLTLSPKLAGGEEHRGTQSEGLGRSGCSGGEALRILAGGELDPPAELTLLGALRWESQLFLRYRIGV